MTEAILLSAGVSSRMGKQNKMFLDYNGMPLIMHAIQALCCDQIDRTILVTGYEHRAIKELRLSANLDIVYNPDYRNGMVTSIQSGINALHSKVDQFLIVLGDMPLLTSAHVTTLLNYALSIDKHEGPYIIRPAWRDQKGHPVIFSKHFIGTILACHNKHRLQSVIKSSENHLSEYKTADCAFYKDIDTPIEYQRLLHE